jgi:hypothetical protein
MALLAVWLFAGGFTVAALGRATAAWRNRPGAVARAADRVPISMPVAAPLIPTSRRCKLAQPGQLQPKRS